jgi:hypothetical protein
MMLRRFANRRSHEQIGLPDATASLTKRRAASGGSSIFSLLIGGPS